MLETIILLFGILAVLSVWPLTKLIDRYTERTDAEDWRRVQEETRTKGVVVGQLRELLKR